jgi:peptidoglycan/LPS O-acetylase OafA/YrhL
MPDGIMPSCYKYDWIVRASAMSISSYLPFVAINLLCLGVALAILLGSRFYRGQVLKAERGRTEMLDGLRGFLALGVFFNHAVNNYYYNLDGVWTVGAAPFYEMTGQVGVSLFFMITGYLFWGRVLRSQGPLDVVSLYLSRIRRIVPMYLASVLMVLAVVAILSGFRLGTDPLSLLKQLRAWLSFGFMDFGALNGFADGHFINPVYWTLAFEWLFYLSLPFLALFAKPPWSFVLLVIAPVFCLHVPVTLNFIAGGIAALLVHKRWLGDRLRSPLWTPVALAALASVFLAPSAYAQGPMVALFVFFLFIVHGNSLFGLLRSAPAKLLGLVSYGFYLVHAIVVFVVVRIVASLTPIGQLGASRYWLVAAAAAAIAVVMASFTYRYIEHPFLSMKDRLPAGLWFSWRALRLSGRSSGG